MTYKLFLFLLSQLINKKLAHVWVGEHALQISACSQEKNWNISTLLSKEMDRKEYRALFGSRSKVPLNSRGCHLHFDETDGLALVQTTPVFQSYQGFKQFVDHFLEQVIALKDVVAKNSD